MRGELVGLMLDIFTGYILYYLERVGRDFFNMPSCDTIVINHIMFFPCSFEGEADGTSPDDCPSRAGDPSSYEDEPRPPPTEAKVGEGQDGRHAEGQDRSQAGPTGAGAPTHPGGHAAGCGPQPM